MSTEAPPSELEQWLRVQEDLLLPGRVLEA